MAVSASSRGVKAVALDFDGTILESVEVKARAFRTLFKDHPAHVEKIVQFHLDHAGVSRFEKFRTIYRDILGLPLSDLERERLGHEFAVLVEADLLTCPFVPGAHEFLKAHARQMPIFIVSGTPEAELRAIVRNRGLERYVHGVFGFPRSKDDILLDILACVDARPSEALYVGDSLADWDASAAVGVRFVGRVPIGAANPFPESVCWIVSDLKDLMSRWDAIMGVPPSP